MKGVVEVTGGEELMGGEGVTLEKEDGLARGD
jgi:hypothetical protein